MYIHPSHRGSNYIRKPKKKKKKKRSKPKPALSEEEEEWKLQNGLVT
jgi:hypothetical protein